MNVRASEFTDGQWVAVETGLGDVHAAALATLATVARQRAAALAGSVTIDLDTTDVEVYGRHKRGVASNYQAQESAARTWRGGPGPRRCWPRTCWPATRTRAATPALLRRALAALPAAARTGKIRLRADAGYFAGQLARAAPFTDIDFAIGACRIAPLWRLLDGLSEADWTDAIDMPGAQVAVPTTPRTGRPSPARVFPGRRPA